MQRDKRDVEAALAAKGFDRDIGDHRFFVYHTVDGLRTPVKTKTSHGTSTRSIGDELLSQMARQCRLTRKDFISLVDCPLSREEYERRLIEADAI